MGLQPDRVFRGGAELDHVVGHRSGAEDHLLGRGVQISAQFFPSLNHKNLTLILTRTAPSTASKLRM